MDVEVTQFMRLNGRPVAREFPVADDLAPKYRALQEAGARLTAEVLMSGEVSWAIEQTDLGDFAIELASNDPADPKGPEALDKLIRNFDIDKYRKWEREARAEW